MAFRNDWPWQYVRDDGGWRLGAILQNEGYSMENSTVGGRRNKRRWFAFRHLTFKGNNY